MPDPGPPGGRWPSEPSPAARQVHAVLAWLVVEADVPNSVHLHLADALLAWAPLMGEHLFPTEPEDGVDADLRQLLDGMWWRLDAQAVDARWVDKVVVKEVRGGIGQAPQAPRALQALLAPAVVCRCPGHLERVAPRSAWRLTTRWRAW